MSIMKNVTCPYCGEEAVEELNGEYRYHCWYCDSDFDDLYSGNSISFHFSNDDDDEDIPEGCAACGGDYPNCKISCNLFDEDDD